MEPSSVTAVCSESSAAIWAAWATAIGTLALAFVTVWLGKKASEGTSQQIGVQTWLALEERFDSNDVKIARKLLAEKCDPYEPLYHDEIKEDVLNLFESIATVYYIGLLNKDLAQSSFSWHAARWWEAVNPYVAEERRRKDNDASLFKEFEKFACEMKGDDRITSHDLQAFLADEKKL